MTTGDHEGDEVDPPGGSTEPGGVEAQHGSGSRAFDTVLGAAARAARATGSVFSGGERIIDAVADSTIGRVAGSAARRITEPLAQEGAEVREQLSDDVPTAARNVSSRLLPAVVETIEPNQLLEAIDVEHLMERIDVNGVVGRVDIDALVGRVDIDALLSRVDIDALLARIDPNLLLDRIDFDAVLQRIDLNAAMEKVDMDALVQRTEIGAIIARSTTGLAGEAIDSVRRQGVSLDNVVARVVDRLLRRDRSGALPGPPLLVTVPIGALEQGPS